MFSYERITEARRYYVKLGDDEVAGPFGSITQAKTWIRKNLFVGVFFFITLERTMARGVV